MKKVKLIAVALIGTMAAAISGVQAQTTKPQPLTHPEK